MGAGPLGPHPQHRAVSPNTPPRSAPPILKTSVSPSRPISPSITSSCAGRMRSGSCTTARSRPTEKALELTRALVETGIDSAEAVAQAEVTLKNAEAAEPALPTNRALYEHAIATLIGKPASELFDAREDADDPSPRFPSAFPRNCCNGVRISPPRNAPWRRQRAHRSRARQHTTRR